VDAARPEEVLKLFVECIAAPGFADRAKGIFAERKSAVAGAARGCLEPEHELQLKRILGGMLCSSRTRRNQGGSAAYGNEASANGGRMRTMRFAWKGGETREVECDRVCEGWRDAGSRAGQMSRVDR